MDIIIRTVKLEDTESINVLYKEADERHQCQSKQEPGIFKVTRQEIGQRPEIENDPTTA